MPLGAKKQNPKNGAGKKAGKVAGMKVPARKRGKSKQFVLLIGDEGAILVFMEGSKVVRRLFAPTPQPASTEALVQLMQANPAVPLSVLVDSIDQQYVRQSFPPVSSLSVGSLVKRRLDRDFQTEDLKNYLPIGRDKTGRKEWNFLLIAVASTATFKEWLDLVMELPNEFKGIYLVPVEATNYIAMLRGTSGQPLRPWQLLVTHNKVSGFRQVVTQNGKLVFTRVTQAIDDAIPAVIAGNIEQEIINTIEYLRRLGFNDNSTLDITVVASSDVNEVLDLRRFSAGGSTVLSPLQISDALGFEQAALSADRFGDVVMAAAFLRTSKHVLKFTTAYANKLSSLYQLKKGLMIASALLALLLVGLSTQNILGMLENQAQTQTSTSKKTNASNELTSLQERVDGLNQDLAYKAAVVSTYDLFEPRMFNPTEFMAQLAGQLKPEQSLLTIDWALAKQESPPTSGQSAPKQEAAAPLTVKAEFEMKGTYADVDALEKAELAFIDALTQAMPDYTITHEPFPWQKDAGKTVEISFDQRQSAAITEGNNKLTLIFAGPKSKMAPAAGNARPAAKTPQPTPMRPRP